MVKLEANTPHPRSITGSFVFSTLLKLFPLPLPLVTTIGITQTSIRMILFTLICLIFIPFNDVAIAPVQRRNTPLYSLHSLEWPLEITARNTLSLEGVATPRHFRLVHCRAYLDEHILRVVEWKSLDDMKAIPYAAISYVWRGNHRSPISNSFTVDGAADSDRIDLEVLRVTCTSAVQKGADYLWMDQLCIMQTDTEDKNWQIQKMAAIYKHSTVCLVLLGGMGGLVGEGETTSWIHRSWTLQEALLPRHTYCIIKWTRGPGALLGMTFERNQTYAVLPIKWLLRYTLPQYSGQPFIPLSDNGPRPGSSVSLSRLFSDESAARCVLYATLSKNRHLDWNEDETESKDERRRERIKEYDNEINSAIWRSVSMRTSTRDIDIVFSTMGLFGVELDPTKYETPLEALIAFLQQLLEHGHRASWLAASASSPGILPPLVHPLQHILFPTIQDGYLKAHPDSMDWYLENPPTGSLDSTGALKIVAPLSPMTMVGSWAQQVGSTGCTRCGSDCEEAYLLSGRIGTHAVGLGRLLLDPMAHIGCEPEHSPETLMMLLKPLDDKWYKVGMAVGPLGMTDEWEEQEVTIVGDTSGQLYSSDLA